MASNVARACAATLIPRLDAEMSALVLLAVGEDIARVIRRTAIRRWTFT
jgi:hypothetical protein